MNFSIKGLAYNIVLFLLTLCATVTLLLANVGSIKKNKGVTSIFFLELNFSEDSFSELVPTVGSYLSTTENIYTFGMYGYCRGESDENESDEDETLYAVDFTVDSCTNPKPMYVFDPDEFIQAEVLNQTGYNLTDSEIELPTKIDNYVSTARNLSKATYITSCIAIGLNVITLIFTIVNFFIKPLFSVFAASVEMLAFIAAVLASGCSTGMFKYIQTSFNNSYSSYGIKAELSRNYLILTWLGTSLSAVVFIILAVNGCMGCCGPAFGRIDRRDVEKPSDVESSNIDSEKKETADSK